MLSNFENLSPKQLGGFKNLFKILGLAFVVTQFLITYYESSGRQIVDTVFLLVISQDIPLTAVFYAVALLIAMCVPTLQKMVLWGWITIYQCEVLHYFVLCFSVLTPILCVEYWRLPPTQATFVLFQMVLISMKMHSYVMQNQVYHLQYIKRLAAMPTGTTNDKTSSITERREPALPTDVGVSTTVGAGAGGGGGIGAAAGGGGRSIVSDEGSILSDGSSEDESEEIGEDEDADRWGSNSNAPSQRYPANITYANFFEFLFMPTLVYQYNFPRTPRVRPTFVIKTLFAIVGVLTLLYMALAHYILPILRKSNELPFLYLLALLCIPCSILYIIIFFFVFEIILNGYAEVTRFADRHFYDDWWNSTAYDEFMRKWNRPIHEWLLIHIYNRRILGNHSKLSALWITFLFSHLIYEVLLAVAFGVKNPWLLIVLGLEVIFIYILRSFRDTEAGNLLWWCIMLISTPFVTTLYARDYYMR